MSYLLIIVTLLVIAIAVVVIVLFLHKKHTDEKYMMSAGAANLEQNLSQIMFEKDTKRVVSQVFTFAQNGQYYTATISYKDAHANISVDMKNNKITLNDNTVPITWMWSGMTFTWIGREYIIGPVERYKTALNLSAICS